jgi:hypothetical protein
MRRGGRLDQAFDNPVDMPDKPDVVLREHHLALLMVDAEPAGAEIGNHLILDKISHLKEPQHPALNRLALVAVVRVPQPPSTPMTGLR